MPSSFPTGVEVPNDDSPNNNQQDEDSVPTNDHIYSRDMPGFTTDIASCERRIYRFNMNEFVRVRLDGEVFENQNDQVEGSRCSPLTRWRSRMDVIRDPATGKWKRNGTTENEIVIGHKPLLPK